MLDLVESQVQHMDIRMPSSTVEDYLKAIYHCSDGRPGTALVSPGAISEALKLTAGTVTVMLKSLETSGYVKYQPRRGVKLTKKGTIAAVKVIRRHRLIELFLMQHLEYSWEEVHAEAEIMEHSVSDLFIERVEKLLGYPKFDPHGAPIPMADGSIKEAHGIPLSEAPLGPKRLVQVLRQEPDFLKWLADISLFPGEKLEVIEKDNVVGTVTLKTGGEIRVISAAMSGDLIVSPQA